jgi:hypothetical protein
VPAGLLPTARRRGCVLALAVLACLGSAWADARPARAANDVSSFTMEPSSLTAGGHPSISTAIAFNYASGSDSVKNLTVTLPLGLQADLGAVPAACTPAQLATATNGGPGCPAGSKIGTGTVTASVLNATSTLYLMPAPSGSDLAGLGLVASVAGVPMLTSTGTVDVTTAAGQPTLDMKFTDLPDSLGLLTLQIKSLTLTINGTAPTSSGATSSDPFVRMPTSCGLATATLEVDTYAAAGDGSATSGFTPTDCSSLGFTPTLAASVTRDAGNGGAQIAMTISQPASGQAAASSATLAIPESVLSPNLINALADLTHGTEIGTATVDTPLLPTSGSSFPTSPLTGTVTLTGTAVNTNMVVTFAPPLSFTLIGTVNAFGADSKVTFASIPDIPFTHMTMTLFGGQSAAFDATCNPAAGSVTGSFTGWNAPSSPVSVSTPFAVSGCPPAVSAASPTVSHGGLTGAGRGHPRLDFTLTAGRKAKIDSFVVSLPKGLSFIASRAPAKGVSVKGARVRSAAITAGKLHVRLASGASRLKVRLSSRLIRVSPRLERRIRKHQVRSLVARIRVDGKTLRLRLTKLS